MPKAKRSKFRRNHFNFATILIALLAVSGVVLLLVNVILPKTAVAACTLSDTLVNSCRPWFGTTVGGYPQATSATTNQVAFGEKRLNDPNVLNNPTLSPKLTMKYDIIHTYHSYAQTAVNATEKDYINRANTYLLMNWKPDNVWKNANGGNATVNGRIDAMAASIKALGSKKIFLTVFHEPENDVSVGNCATPAPGAGAGSPADYVAMWKNVRERFDAKGVNNVVWVMNYMGYGGWDCLVNQLWPGNGLVDWITYDPYGSGADTPAIIFERSTGRFYDHLTKQSNSSHNYLSKAWGLAEHGVINKHGTTQAAAIAYWDQAKKAIETKKYPKLKMYITFDTTVNGTSRVGYDFTDKVSTTEQAAYNGFAKAIFALSGGATPTPAPAPKPKDTTRPSGTFLVPKWNAVVKGSSVTVTVNAKDNVGVSKVRFFVDSDDTDFFAEDTKAPFTVKWNSREESNGTHWLRAKVFDAAGNSKTPAIKVRIAN